MRTSVWRRCSTAKPRRPATRSSSRSASSAALPVVGPQSEFDVRDLRAEARYWRTDYASLAPQRDAAGSLTETNPALQLVSANAAFRTTQQAADRLDAVRRLDTVVKTYADVLRNGGGQVDAAYNYELAVRTRDMLAKPRAAAPKAAPKASSDRRGSRSARGSDAAWQTGRTAAGGQHESVQDRHPEARRGTQRRAGRGQGWHEDTKGIEPQLQVLSARGLTEAQLRAELTRC